MLIELPACLDACEFADPAICVMAGRLAGRMPRRLVDEVDTLHCLQPSTLGVGTMADDFNAQIGINPIPMTRPTMQTLGGPRQDVAPAARPTEPVERSSRSSRESREDWSGPQTPIQVRLPADLIKSLKLQGFDTGKSISELVLECLTTAATIERTWVSTRRKAG